MPDGLGGLLTTPTGSTALGIESRRRAPNSRRGRVRKRRLGSASRRRLRRRLLAASAPAPRLGARYRIDRLTTLPALRHIAVRNDNGDGCASVR
jgi:hypothetical protein